MALEKINTYFISDTHFFHHPGILSYCPNRKFSTIEEMNEHIIARWNKYVRPNDIVYFLGDFGMKATSQQLKEICSRLNGYKLMVKGNHDLNDSQMKSIGFEYVFRELKLKIGGEVVTLSHYPYKINGLRLLWIKVKNWIMNRSPRNPHMYLKYPIDGGQFLLHGHTHSLEKVNGRQIHIGWDAWDKPVSTNEICSLIDKIKKKEEKSYESFFRFNSVRSDKF